MPSAEGRGGGVSGEEGEESGKEGGNNMDPNYALSGKLTADTNTFRVYMTLYIKLLRIDHIYSLVPRPSLNLPAFNVAHSSRFLRATLKAGRSREGLGMRL